VILRKLFDRFSRGSAAAGRPVQEMHDVNVGANLLEWPERSVKAVEMAKKQLPQPGVRVADYGCGRQTARTLLPQGWEYVPFDYCSRTPDTVLCDFTTSLPDGLFDLILCLGVLEYMEEPFRLLQHALEHGGRVLFSYNGPTTAERRELQGWKNCLDFDEIERFIACHGGSVLEKTDLGKNEWIYLVRSGGTT
jgi:hypothetical protein